jgi:hypothetical protein
VIGPLTAEKFLKEAHWVVETWKTAQRETNDFRSVLRAFYRGAHLDRLREEYGLDLHRSLAQVRPPLYGISTVSPALLIQKGKMDTLEPQARIHLLLAATPLPNLWTFSELVRSQVLNETPRK